MVEVSLDICFIECSVCVQEQFKLFFNTEIYANTVMQMLVIYLQVLIVFLTFLKLFAIV